MANIAASAGSIARRGKAALEGRVKTLIFALQGVCENPRIPFFSRSSSRKLTNNLNAALKRRLVHLTIGAQ